MSADPILVMQTHRMGDLILTFPLLVALKRQMPQHPVWLVAEPDFFQQLMPLSPDVVFFPPSHCPTLAQGKYAMAINLGSRPDAAHCLGQLEAETKIGLATTKFETRVHGFWQLYRTALTQNNRHNIFHWADLNRLDLPNALAKGQAARTPRQIASTRRVALVLGASAQAKHPNAEFWARIAKKLVESGHVPLFLGGKAEIPFGEQVAKISNLPNANLCGKLSLRELADLFKEIRLCITPDTGPMHLADWMGTRVLNLSLGPVNAFETGPSGNGQWIASAHMSCAGCWQCQYLENRCKQAFNPAAIVHIARQIMEKPSDTSPGFANEACLGLSLFRSGRDALDLYHLYPHGANSQSCRQMLDNFWQSIFLMLFDKKFLPNAHSTLNALTNEFPAIESKLKMAINNLLASYAKILRNGDQPTIRESWQANPPLIRLLAGFQHMWLHNDNFSPHAWQAVMEQLAQIRDLLARQ